MFAVAWSASGSHLIVAGYVERPASFAVFRVEEEGRRLVHRFDFHELEESPVMDPVWCPIDAAGIVTANGYVTPPPLVTATATPTASATPTVTATPTATATPTVTATLTPSPTPTPVPRPLYLPIGLREECRVAQKRVDVALVIDASSSMDEPASAGRSKWAAALEAVRTFLDLLDLSGGDQAAIVWFNARAKVAQGLTGERAALVGALERIPRAQFTRIDLGVVEARKELTSERHRRGNAAVMVLLTDGLANPVGIEVAVREAEEAKAAGITVFTIGLGYELDEAGLIAMASSREHYLWTPDAEELTAIYRRVAERLPCPAEQFWGRR